MAQRRRKCSQNSIMMGAWGLSSCSCQEKMTTDIYYKYTYVYALYYILCTVHSISLTISIALTCRAAFGEISFSLASQHFRNYEYRYRIPKILTEYTVSNILTEYICRIPRIELSLWHSLRIFNDPSKWVMAAP